MDGDYWEAMIDKGQWREFGQDNNIGPHQRDDGRGHVPSGPGH